MKHIITKVVSLVFLFSLITFIACDDEETKPVFGVAFETTAMGVQDKDQTIDVKLTFSVPARVASEITIDVLETGVSHGAEYQTTPASVSNKITVAVPVGAESASFTFKRLAEFIDSGKKVKFTASAVTGESNAVISGNTSIEVSFEAVSSPGNSLVAETGGPTQSNQVYVDLSMNKQTSVARTAWDLGFYSGDKNRVILNYSTYMLAKALDKTDINSVTSADTVGMAGTLMLAVTGSNAFIDHPDGDLTKTVIAEVSATDAQNKVYIINRGGGPNNTSSDPVTGTPRGWKKVRILKNGEGYKIQYADISSTTFQEATITKNSLYNFTFFNFDNGVVNVEPKKNEWDIDFTILANLFNPTTAYGYRDFIRINATAGITAILMSSLDDGNAATNEITYDQFALKDIEGRTFLGTANAFGSSWRNTTSSPVAVRNYIYFVVKDPEGNYYKIQVLSITNDAGERGHTSFKYSLLK